MWSRYVHLHSEEMNDSIYQEAGMDDADDDTASTERRECGTCRETLAPHHEYCPRCGEPVTVAARETKQEATGDLAESMARVEDLSDREFRAFVMRRLEDDASPLSAHEPSSTD